ncbi:ral GTPase-activating protein subunit beta isoform X4 [Glossina fuscipes]|uniref:Ral GTPase-activating protein subunit beta isoform X4 n=1 Tax=Glossina fuscipes TaxID=7396 RepID=A0A8U0WLZ8_9MUSC|nr:ral GTPase-activating protein subunit beta isoform X4 [Glossina fuscipes]
MYGEWVSLSTQITANSCGAQSYSVLNKFPASAGREVAVSVVKQLASNLGITQNAEPSHLVKDEEVNWCMDVICFGLTLPLQEHETIKDCVNVYCEWLTALHPQPRISVPKPICEDANMYCRKIINHFHNLFVPRHGESADTINRQAVLCHRVLRTLQQTAQISQTMDRQTWEALLLFLLAINETLLAPPTIKDDVGDQLCERVLSVLFEVWLLACVRCFPSPSLWKTLQESCSIWRHRVALIDQWNRVNLALTARLLDFTYGSAFPELKISEEDAQLIPAGMTDDCVAQTWYRFLRTIGNPTALCSPHIISKSSHFVQWALTHDKGAETYQHPCLQILPLIFLKAIKGISNQVDAFLGIYVPPPRTVDDVVTNLMDIRLALNEATTNNANNSNAMNSSSALSTSSATAHHHHHHLGFFHHGNITLHLGTGTNVVNSTSNSGSSCSVSSTATLQSLSNSNVGHLMVGSNLNNQQQSSQPLQQHSHLPHLHVPSASQFLRDNFISGTATSALNAIMGHQHVNAVFSTSSSSSTAAASSPSTTTSSGNLTTGTVTTINPSSGSQSAGVIGSINFGLTNVADSSGQLPHSPTPPLQRRLAKSFSVAPTLVQQKGLSKAALIGLTSARSSNTATAAPLTPTSGPPSSSSLNSLPSLGLEQRPPLATARPKCNSILHLFGEWLFEAAYIGGDAWLMNTKKQASEASKRPSSMIMENRKGSISLSQPNSLNDSSSLPSTLTIDKYESGRAEAVGTLCKIFCAKKTGEEILPVYLARFYMALQQCLKITESKECDETLASILLNSSDLFRLDLDGIHVLLPAFIAALEIVLPDKDLKIKTQAMQFNKTELRRSAIHILLSILTLPLHYQTLPIRDLVEENAERLVTFIQLKPRLINILMNALQVETDAQNTHMLLGGLLLTVQDAVTFEDTESLNGDQHNVPVTSSVPHGANNSEANLLSSACSERSASVASVGNSSVHSAATIGNLASAGATAGSSCHGSTAAAATANANNHSHRDNSSQHDYPSLTISDDFPLELLQEFESSSGYDNAHALFVRATYLVCHRLISSWKADLNVSLAALELLSGLARLFIRDSARKFANDALECKRAVKWICDYICYQCSRPPPAHSKDLHSTIVAAYQCTSAWLMQHPYLLQDKDCLQTVLEVVELGISGSKSVGKSGDIPKFKDEKELKPASMRVRDAAENLLTIILEQVGYFPSECGPESISSLLDEVALMKHCNSLDTTNGSSITTEQAISKFKYFVTENSTILALLEEPLGNDQDPQPTVTLLIRGPFGRHAWTMQLRHLPRSKSGFKYHAVNPGRPIPMNDVPQRIEFEQKNFPDGVDKVTPCVADYSIPTFEQIRELYGNDSIKQLETMLENQTIHEKLAWAETDNSTENLSHAQESVPPPVCHEFQAARLFLSHFGFLTFEERDPNSPAETLGTPSQRPLIVLDTKRNNFAQELNALDKLSARTYDTVHVFYVKAGQSTASEIIDNMSDENVHTLDPHFGNMLLTLGWPVDIYEHSGWTGFLGTSWSLKNNVSKNATKYQNHAQLQDIKFNGESKVLYWADVSSEMAFVVPTEWNLRSEVDGPCLSQCSSLDNTSNTTNIWMRQNEASNPQTESVKNSTQRSRNLSLELANSKSKEPIPPTRRKITSMKPALMAQPPAKIFLVWLESFEDHLHFPIEDLLAYSRTGEEANIVHLPRATDVHVIFLHALQSGLLRVKLQGPTGRMSFATPLVDGMILSRRVVGNLVRQTAHNMAKRRRLDNDNFQPPHVRRRLKVQDIVQKYKVDLSESELLVHLFKSSF